MRILFIIPKNKTLFGDEGITGFPHLGIAYLTSFLKKEKKDIKIKIFDEGLGGGLKELDALIDDFKPTLIGITLFSYCYGFGYNLIERLRKKTDIKIVVGGPHVSAIKSKILKETKVDFAVKQEGELTLLELLQELQKRKPDFSGIKGLIWWDKGRIVENSDRGLIRNLDILPFPDFDAFEIEKYACYEQKTLPLVTSRGCPFGCNYCSVRLSMGQEFRPRSPKNVVSEIKHWYKKGFRNFDINDDCFTLDLDRAEKICDLIIKSKLKIKFQLYNGIRVDRITPKLLKKLKRAGCNFIAYGCESGNQETLKRIKKNITLDQVRKAVDWTNKAGIKNAVNFIIGHQGETYQEALDSLKFAKSLPTNFVNFYNLLPYPGTEVYDWAIKYGHFLVPKENFLNEISYRDNVPIFETKEFTVAQRKEIIAMGFDLYRKTILTFRLGKILGNLVYYITNNKIIDKLSTNFALNNPIGRFVYNSLSKKSRET